jgi:hypothetical protein
MLSEAGGPAPTPVTLLFYTDGGFKLRPFSTRTEIFFFTDRAEPLSEPRLWEEGDHW